MELHSIALFTIACYKVYHAEILTLVPYSIYLLSMALIHKVLTISLTADHMQELLHFSGKQQADTSAHGWVNGEKQLIIILTLGSKNPRL